MERGFSILVLAETAEETTLDILDKAIIMIAAHVKVSTIFIWRPGRPSNKPAILPNSRIKVRIVIS